MEAGSDLQIYHDGSNSIIKDAGTGGLHLRSSANLQLQDADGYLYVNCIDGGNGGTTKLYNLNQQKLATSSSGIDVTGTVTADGLIVDGNNDIQINRDGVSAAKIFWNRSGTTDAKIELAADENLTIGVDEAQLGGKNLIFRNNASQVMTIDSSGNLLVGCTSAGASNGITLHSSGYIQPRTNTGIPAIYADREGSDGSIIELRKDGSAVGSIGAEGGDLVLGTGTNCGIQFNDGNAAIRPFNMASNSPVDNAVDLGISSTRFKDLYLSGQAYANTYRHDGDSDTYLNFPAANQLSLVGGGATILKAYQIAGAYGVLEAHGSGSATYPNYTFNGDSNTGMYRATTDTLGFTTGGSEKMRIDSSGRLLIGHQTAKGYALDVDKANIGVASFNRTGTDGEVVSIRKDGSTVGSIGNNGANIIYFAGAGSGVKILNPSSGFDGLMPSSTTGADRDASMDLGSANTRFKDLYLSGGAYLGGTGSANKLDDYEEGTWTPSLSNANNITSSVAGSATYRKVGSLVYINLEVTGDVTSSTVETRLAISLPFVADSTTYKDVGHVTFFAGTGDDRFGVGSLYLGTTANSLTYIYVSAGQMNSNTSTEFRCSLVYRAA